MSIANTPKPPYYAVIFSSIIENDNEKYHVMAKEMEELAKIQPGFLGFETARNSLGISVSYWENVEAIQNWRTNVEHMEAKSKGKMEWYNSYKVRISKVERDYSFDKL